MKKIIAVLSLVFFLTQIYAEQTAYSLVKEAEKKSNADEAQKFLEDAIKKISVPSEKRALYAFLGSLQEQLGLYDAAQKSYAAAASISSGDAENMPKKSNEQLVLDAVRCALNSGDYSTAETFFNSSVRNSKDEKIQCYIKLYSVWASLCKAETTKDLEEPLALLKAYTSVSTMKEVHPAIFLTLWYITGDDSWANKIKTNFPQSVEASITKGDSQLLPSPFWYFVPKAGIAEPETGTVKEAKIIETETKNEPVQKSGKKSRLQLGLFGSKANATALVDELSKKGFEAYIQTEKRSSGNVYYLVLVDEKNDTTADALRSSGYECYLVE